MARIARFAPVRAVSRVWETAPVGGPEQPWYLNAAVLVEASPTRDLLAACQAVEAALGRVRVPGERNAARTLDIDVLWAGDHVSDDPVLTVPHPRLAERAFAVAPLLDVLPGAVDPRTGAPYAVPRGEAAVTAHRLALPGPVYLRPAE